MEFLQKSLVIPAVIAAAFSAVFWLLHFAGIQVHAVDAVTAGVIAGVAGFCGTVIPQRSRGDAAATFNAALAGTFLHMMLCIALTVAVVLAHVVNKHGQFMFWLLGGYWVSILTLIWLARRIVAGKALKANN